MARSWGGWPELTSAELPIMEQRFGKFHRADALPDSVDTDHVEAVFEDGVPELTPPKREEAKPKRISVKSNSQTETK